MEQLKQRSEVLEQFKWKIEDLVSSDKVWEERFETLKKDLKKLDTFKNNIQINNLYDCLSLRDKISNETMVLYVYANLKKNEDSTNNFYQSLASKADSLISSYQGAIAFLEPEILTLNEDELLKAVSGTNLKLYNQYIKNLLRTKSHILSTEKEEILANAYEISQSADNIFSMLNNADADFGYIKDENGKDIKVTHGNYTMLLENPNRNIREQAFKAMYKFYHSLKNTIATTYTSSVKADIFNAKVRNYNSSIEHALSETNVSLDVYKNLISTVHKFLPALHKYIDIRKKRLGLSEIHFYDLYTPIVKDVNKKIDFEEGKKIVLEALKPLGEDYIKNLQKAFDSRWIDVYENVGKRSGAYVWGAYGCHPFVSLNYTDTLDDMFTLAHEMGHAMHSYYTTTTQPYIYGDYTIFLAEVASTVNEALLMEHLLKTTDKEEEQLYLINHFMEQFRGTLFRQTMFAEFEMIVHEKMENGQPQTFESLCEIYKDLNIKYYGNDIVIDEEITWEWARIPHFYSAFYVYQYATGYSCAISFSKKILEENGRDDYLGFLKSGSSDYSTEILKKAGVDMTKTEPIENALKVFEELVEKMDKIS
ncbi:oligoendopeptidase F [uncultured Tyzzerella sp.]|uniref:oligoendopeptidase F n=1 Tax=uncultured Tyzzerella sp. TaxID=2321398 RepID=UPI0029435B75|nr:oligoendopeptidase F [uncultured Tyzzerella sp.]